jgi:hypothetical protein
MRQPPTHKLNAYGSATCCGLRTSPADWGFARMCAGEVSNDIDKVTCRRCLRAIGYRGLTTAAIERWIERLTEGIQVRQRLLARLQKELERREKLPNSTVGKTVGVM